MIKAGLPVFFGCDVGKFSDQETGIMDTALFEYEVNPDFHSIKWLLISPLPSLPSTFASS